MHTKRVTRIYSDKFSREIAKVDEEMRELYNSKVIDAITKKRFKSSDLVGLSHAINGERRPIDEWITEDDIKEISKVGFITFYRRHWFSGSRA